MRTITREFLDKLINFAPSGTNSDKDFGNLQADGTVASFNMLARNGCAYLADEVGMGKTYIALGVMSLLRYFDPYTRIVVIAPRENIQQKWVKEMHNFVRNNWRVVGNRVKSLESRPVWEPVVCNSLIEFAREATVNQDRDFFLRMTSFSIRLSDSNDRHKTRAALLATVPWLKKRDIPNRCQEDFRDAFAGALNGVIPDADLVIFDEAHNLKHGIHKDASTRNQIMGRAFGRPGGNSIKQPWYSKKAKRVLFLSATPFEDDYAAIQRQLSVFGFGGVHLKGPDGEEGISVGRIACKDIAEEDKKQVVQRLLIRRVAGLNIAGKFHTKNMYRREWRRGGLTQHDETIQIVSPKHRLIVALIQKKVAEVLQSERFNNQFQVGMLSSFESFLQSVEVVRRRDRSEAAFDGEEQLRGLNDQERNGIDTEAIVEVANSYQKVFGSTLPHPKLDATVSALSKAFESGEKSLVFVRRVATVDELTAKLNESFDDWIRGRMESFLPNLHHEIKELFEVYAKVRSRRLSDIVSEARGDGDTSQERERIDKRDYLDQREERGSESFFEWFFRGDSPTDLLSGAAFKNNRLNSISSPYATLFEDDYVAQLLDVDGKSVLESLARVTGNPLKKCRKDLRDRAWIFFTERSGMRDGYPRQYVFEAYQAAGLKLLCSCDGELGERARIVLTTRFKDIADINAELPEGFPDPEAGLGITTVFTELRRKRDLRERLWPVEFVNDSKGFEQQFLRLEQRKELISSMARLGAAYVDLYLLAIHRIGTFNRAQQSHDESASKLAVAFVELLESQMNDSGFGAFSELSQAAQAFDHIVSVNFPELHLKKLTELRGHFADTLQNQVPVGKVSGKVNHRLVRQFRMPGFPLVLVTTDVLQEGEDLHTHCKRVVHYGIAWTPSAIEQRTGRVDRIGGLVQRHLDGSTEQPDADELIQVYYPHLRDTVELLQVRRVLARVNRFMQLIHRGVAINPDQDGLIETQRAWLEELRDIPQIEGELESAFPIESRWLEGELGKAADICIPNWERQYEHLHRLWKGLNQVYRTFNESETRERHVRKAQVPVDAGGLVHVGTQNEEKPIRWQDFMLRLRSKVAGDETMIESESSVGLVDLKDDRVVDTLLNGLEETDYVKLCVEPRVSKNRDQICIRRELLFDSNTDLCDIQSMFENTVCPAVRLRNMLESANLLDTGAD